MKSCKSSSSINVYDFITLIFSSCKFLVLTDIYGLILIDRVSDDLHILFYEF